MKYLRNYSEKRVVVIDLALYKVSGSGYEFSVNQDQVKWLKPLLGKQHKHLSAFYGKLAS